MAKRMLDDFNGLPGHGDIIDQVAHQHERLASMKKETAELKANTDFKGLLTWFGFEVKKNGSGWKVLCPFHNDTDPSCSVNFKKGCFHCFGCGTKGDVIEFVKLYKHTDFKGAMEVLKEYTGLTGQQKRPVKKEKPLEIVFAEEDEVEKNNLIKNVTSDYHKQLLKNEKALAYLEKRGLKDFELINRFSIGYCDGATLCKKLSDKQKGLLKQSGIITAGGKEHFTGCVVFPVTLEQGDVGEIYGRNITGSNPSHRYLKGRHKGIFNHKASSVYDTIIIVESVIDCLSLITLGFENVQPLYGAGTFTDEHLQALKNDRVKEVVLGLDNDTAGRNGCEKHKKTLLDEGFGVKVITPPVGKDWNDCLAAGTGKQEIQALIDNGTVFTPQRKETGQDDKLKYEKKQDAYHFKIDGLTYRIIGFNKSFTTALKVNIRAFQKEKSIFKVFNMYNEVALEVFVKSVSEKFDISGDIIKEHFEKIILFFEDERDRYFNEKETGKQVYILSPAEQTKTLDILTGSDLFADHLFPDLEKMGLVGEQVNKEACYLSVISRLIKKPINICTLSTYGTGKSYLHDTIHKLVPDEDLKSYARITKNDLYYREEENAFVGKVLSIDEIEGLGESLYSIRTLISSGYLSISYTKMNPETGKLGSQENKVIGRPSIFCTGTSDENIDEETLSRFLLLTTDVSNEQRYRIKQRQFYEMTLSGLKEKREQDKITDKHKNILRLIKKIDVVFPSSWDKAIKNLNNGEYSVRDNLCYLSLIASYAVTEQHTRKILTATDENGSFQYIESSKRDVERANHIMREIFGKSIKDLTPPQKHFLCAVRSYAKDRIKGKNLTINDVTFYEKDLRAYAGMSAWQVNHYLNDLVKLEYIILDSRGRHNRKCYRLEFDGNIEELEQNNTKYLAGLIDPEGL